MLVCGIDVGSRTVKAVLMRDGRIAGKAICLAGLEPEKDLEQALAAALAAASAVRGDVGAYAATGAGREIVGFAPLKATVITCAARGAKLAAPEARMVIDVGAEEGRAIQCEDGRVLNFVVNEKCAAGAGTFIESMSRALEIPMETFGPLALRSTRQVAMNAQCAVFAESEVVSLIHDRTPREDIARAVCDAMAGRIGSMTRRLAITPPVALCGGVAHNVAFVRALGDDLKVDLVIPADPEYMPAIGAALMAAEEQEGGTS